MKDLSIDAANFFGLTISMVLYGVFLAMFLRTIDSLWARRRRALLIMLLTISLVIVATINVVLIITYNYNGWIKYREVPGMDVPYFVDQWNSNVVIRYLFMVAAAGTSDILIVWRMYHIWGRNRKLVILPIFLLIIELAVEINLSVMCFKHFTYTDSYKGPYMIFEIVACTCSVLVNGGCTAMIVWRIWWFGRDMPDSRARSRYWSIVIALVESGAMYTITLLIWVVLALIPQFVGIYRIITYIITMVVFIAPMLIVQQLNNTQSSPTSPGPALGEGVSAAWGPSAGPPVGRRNQDIVSTAIRFAPFGGRSSGTGDVDGGYYVG